MFTNKIYILNYPVSNLKIQAEKYYGYPKDLPEKMTGLVDPNFDWKNSKVAVLNDFGFQMIKYLLRNKNCKLENLTMLLTESKYCENLEAEFSFTGLSFDYIDLETKEMKNNFDLIIANPPYGKSSCTAQNILKLLLATFQKQNSVVYLSPTNVYKSSEIRSWLVQDITRLQSRIFQDAMIYDLCLAKLSNTSKNTKSYAEIVLDEKHLRLHKSIKEYNRKHSTDFQVETRNVIDCKDVWNKLFAFSYAISNNGTTDVKSWKEKLDLSIFDKKRQGPTSDIKFNFGIDYEDYYNRLQGNVSLPRLINMQSTQKRDNFKDWYYKAGKLVNSIRNIISTCENITPKAECYISYFPYIDWSKTWTDMEILEELGLPKDFLL